jgi:alkaline phosphatase
MLLRMMVAGLWLCGLVANANAQTIYPIDRAEILVGARFDLKVEFPGTPDVKDLKVKINGEDAAKVLGVEPQVIEREDGSDHTAFWIKQVALSAAGDFKVEAAAGNRTAEVTWQAFDTPKGRVAKNIILFIGDGLSVAHRTAARILSKGIKEGRYGGELAIDDMPHMALVSTHGSDSIVPRTRARSITPRLRRSLNW